MSAGLDYLVAGLLLTGGAFALIGSFGLARLRDFYKRLHGPTKATTLGVGCILIGSSLTLSVLRPGVSVHELLITVFCSSARRSVRICWSRRRCTWTRRPSHPCRRRTEAGALQDPEPGSDLLLRNSCRAHQLPSTRRSKDTPLISAHTGMLMVNPRFATASRVMRARRCCAGAPASSSSASA